MPNKAPRRMGFRMILLAMCALLIVVVASLAPPRPQSTTTDRLKPDDLSLTLAACNKAQDAVKTALKAPATAQFPSCAWSMSQYEVRGSPDRTAFSVTGHVDAQNSFGAMLREQFVVKLTKVGSDPYTGWTVTGVALQ